MYCQKCGAEVKGNFCPNCGEKQEQPQVTPVVNKCPVCCTEYIGNFCPNGCNSPHYQKGKKKGKAGKIALIIVACFFGFAALMGILFGEETPESTETGNSTSSTATSEEQIEYIPVTADELWNAFSDNEVLAEQTYSGKYVKVTGIVSEINSSAALSSANILLRVDNAVFSCVQCNFNSKNEKSLANIEKGQRVTIYGVCGDLSLNVMVNYCEIK